jgi:hypothetical protein
MRSVALGILLLAITVAGWWLWREPTGIAPLPAPNPAGTSTTSPPGTSPAQANTTLDQNDTSSTPASTQDRVSILPADFTWVVRGVVTKASQTPYPGALVRLQSFAGQSTDGTPQHEAVITTDATGHFEWPLPVPKGTVTLVGKGAMPNHASYPETLLVAHGDPAPQDFNLYVVPKDRIVTGTVLDEREQPIANAWVGSFEEKQPVAADGTFRIEVASGHAETSLQAGARGFATMRQTLVVGDQNEATANFRLLPGFHIAGRVTDEADQPIEGAKVATFFTLYEPVVTDADGHYEITHADAAKDSHSLFARKSGYLEAKTEVKTRATPATHDLVLKRGVRVHGRVFAPNGSPVAGASLYIGFSPNAYDRLDAISGDDGSFEFPAVAAGSQTMVTSRKGFAPDTQVFAVPSGQSDLLVDIHLQPPHTLAGVVVDESGKPLAGISLSVLQKRPGSPAGRDSRGEYLELRTKSASDGTFQIEGLPSGVVNLEAYSRRTVRKLEYDVAVDRRDVRMVLQMAAQLAAKVVDDVTEAPIVDFRVHFVQSVQQKDGERPIQRYSATWVREGIAFHNEEGIFRTVDEAFEPGAIGAIQVTADGYAPAIATRLVASPDPDPSAVLVRMRRGCKVTGKVLSDGDGTPIAGAQILHFDDARPRHQASDFGGQLRTTSAADGSFVLANVPPGDASFEITAAGRPPFVDGPIVVPSGGTVERIVRIPAGATVTGVVLDADGVALQKVNVQLYREGSNPASTTSGPDGRFRFAEEFLPGDWTITGTANRDGISFALHQPITLVAGAQTEIVLRPEGRGVLRGTLDGEAAAGQSFFLSAWRTAGSNEAARHYSANCAEGRFELRGLPAGEYEITVYTPGGAGGSAKCTIDAAKPTEIKVTVTAPALGR